MRAWLRVKRSKGFVGSPAFRRRSRNAGFRLKAVLRTRGMIREKHFQLLIVGILLSLCACAAPEPGSDQPTPEAARRFLKLRGYEFDDQSFLSAAKAGDEVAVNGFIAGGINPNAKDDNGDTALTAAAARGDLQIVKALL